MDLGCPAVDGRRQRVLAFEEQVGIVDRTRPGGCGGKLPNPLQSYRTEELEYVGFRARPSGEFVVQRAIAGRPQRFGVGEQRAEFGEDLAGGVIVVGGLDSRTELSPR